MCKDLYLALGSNIDDRIAYHKKAETYISKYIGTITKYSSFYENPPVGFEADTNFINSVIAVRSTLPPLEILNITQNIEKQLGRKYKEVYTSRTIDIDIILYGHITVHSNILKIPHPEILNRAFVLLPLLEIEPNIHIGQSNIDLNTHIKTLDTRSIKKIERHYT